MLPPIHRALLPALALLGEGTSAAAEKVTYDDHVLPLFQQSCLNCHNPDKAKGGLDLSTFSGTMQGGSGGKIAEPGDPSSKLLAVVLQSAEPKMPPEGDKLAATQIDILKAWIDGGLLENKNSSARKPTKPKFDTALKSDPGAKPEGPPPMPAHLLLEPPVLAPRAAAVHAIAASPWAPLLAVTGQRQVLLFDTNSLELVGILPFPEGDPISLAFTPNARYLIVGGGIPGKSGLTVTFDVVSGERMLTAAKEFDSVLAADLKPDLSLVASGSPSKLVKLWQAADGSQFLSIKKHSDWVTALDFSPDGILLATGDRNGGVWVWEADSGGEFHTLRGHQAAITSIAFRPDSNVLASASEDGSVRFWEMNGGAEIRKLDAHPGGVLAFAWGRDGSFITAGRDRVVKLWKADFNLLREFKDQADLPLAVAIDADSKRAFAADYRGQITAWNMADGQPLGSIDTNPPPIAQRLASIQEELQAHPQVLATANAALAEARQQVAAAQQQLANTETALREARDAHGAASTARQQAEQQLNAHNQQLATKKDQAAAARTRLDASQAESTAKRQVLAAIEQKVLAATQLQQSATADLQNTENELARARSENRVDAIPALESALQARQPALHAANRSLEEALSERAREQGALAGIDAAQQAAAAEMAGFDAEAAALAAQSQPLTATRDSAQKAEAEALAHVKEREAGIAPAREAVAKAEQSAGAAQQKLEQEQQRPDQLRARQHHWQAASINTDALKAAAAAQASQLEADDQLSEFNRLAHEVTDLGTRLAEARKVNLPHKDLLLLEEKLRTSTAAFTHCKAEADRLLPRARQLQAQAVEWKARYQAAFTTR
ncbi:MAG: hypothetical protein EAZ84_12655 [Verrucomicrobia bacterium]|nr:MAG: hypothetical protein EAZ84_12655 [Verrucomicrobiota bacterium]TAE85513.1 MAG: hypothetical protein EAZ82_13195 [Verrucomicrobiota bacterium]TAF22908.1 MAG: hypothetical protein EAZ71_13545 [Verrucomicrobiota bacterium]